MLVRPSRPAGIPYVAAYKPHQAESWNRIFGRAASHGKIGQIYVRMGRRAEAIDIFQNGRTLIVAMAGCSGHSRWADYLASFDRDIAALDE